MGREIRSGSNPGAATRSYRCALPCAEYRTNSRRVKHGTQYEEYTMHIRIIHFTYAYKNTPDRPVQDYSVIPVGSDAEARQLFWLSFAMMKSLEWAEVQYLIVTDITARTVDIT